MKPIPISAAKRIAEAYGYHQVVIIARAVGENGGEHCTTYGVDKENCSAAARIGAYITHKIMGWARPDAKPVTAFIVGQRVRIKDTGAFGIVESVYRPHTEDQYTLQSHSACGYFTESALELA